MKPASATRWRAADLAAALGVALVGDGDTTVDRAAELGAAGPGDLAALYDPRRAAEARASRAGLLVVPERAAAAFAGRTVLVARAPRAAFARAVALIHPEPRPEPGVDPTAVVGEGTTLAAGVSIGPHAVVGDRCTIGARAVIGPGCVVGDDVTLGEGTVLHARAVVYARCELGARCLLLAGAVIGSPGFGQARDENGHVVRVPHLGRVVLEDDVEIGANATVDRATFGETRLRARARIDNLVQVAHNCELGEDAMIAAQSGLSGSSRLGRGVMVGGQSGLADHVNVGDGAAVAAKTAVFADVAPGEVVAGTPAIPIARWRRLAAVQARLPEMWKALKRLGPAGPGEGEDR